MMGFTQIERNLFKCDTCGEEVPSGIANISGHWVRCEGKEFSKELFSSFISGTLSLSKLEELRSKYLVSVPQIKIKYLPSDDKSFDGGFTQTQLDELYD